MRRIVPSRNDTADWTSSCRPRRHQRVDGEGGVADPHVAVVPVLVAADPFGQRRRRRGGDRPGVGEHAAASAPAPSGAPRSAQRPVVAHRSDHSCQRSSVTSQVVRRGRRGSAANSGSASRCWSPPATPASRLPCVNAPLTPCCSAQRLTDVEAQDGEVLVADVQQQLARAWPRSTGGTVSKRVARDHRPAHLDRPVEPLHPSDELGPRQRPAAPTAQRVGDPHPPRAAS